jgi:hypothetical protein
MMTDRARTDDSAARHLTDGVLLALHDQEPSAELELDRAHVDRCADCRTRLAAIADRSNHVRTVLARIAVPSVGENEFRRGLAATRGRRVVSAWRRRVWLTGAAVSILAGAAAASPIRRWIGLRLESRQPPVRSLPTPRGAIVAPTQSQQTSGATVSFAPTGADFTMRFDSLPEAGVLTARHGAASEISARVVSGAGTGGDALVVLPGELRVRNTTSSRASYTILLPIAVTRLRVIIAGDIVFDGSPPMERRLHSPR